MPVCLARHENMKAAPPVGIGKTALVQEDLLLSYLPAFSLHPSMLLRAFYAPAPWDREQVNGHLQKSNGPEKYHGCCKISDNLLPALR